MINYELHFFTLLNDWLEYKNTHDKVWADYEEACDELASVKAELCEVYEKLIKLQGELKIARADVSRRRPLKDGMTMLKEAQEQLQLEMEELDKAVDLLDCISIDKDGDGFIPREAIEDYHAR